MMRWLYTLTLTLLTPVILFRLASRGLRAPAYFGRWMERFGWFEAPPMNRSIWVHAVSVGEFNAAIPLIRALMARHPQQRFVITTVTPTGSDRVVQVFGDQVFHCYLPYDLPGAIRRFLDRTRPLIAVIMETEIWPNLYFELAARKVPIVIANARLSQQSLKGYRPVRRLAGLAIKCANVIAAQTQTDADRLIALGANPDSIQVVGNIKFDISIPLDLQQRAEDWRQAWGPARPVFVAASTHADEEEPVMRAFARVLRRIPDAVMILVPRHPERFEAAAALCRSLGYRTAQRSQVGLPGRDVQCFVADTMGELLLAYAASDVAFVGGSLARVGGHNALEAAAQGKPVLVGPQTFNFEEVNALLQEQQALVVVQSGEDLGDQVIRLLSDPQLGRRMGAAGQRVVESQRGALECNLDLIDRSMPTLRSRP